MGALHEGHAHLIREGAALSSARGLGGVVVTIFVNPSQFNDPKDFERYPKTLEADAALCEHSGAAIVYAPDVSDVYPADELIETPSLPIQATQPGLEDAQRPGHFGGVCRVVKRLFELVRPGVAMFGEKDWQQLQVIRAMTDHEQLGVEIKPVETVRESGGLAMSSRNRFLSLADRERGLAISRALCEAQRAVIPSDAEAIMRDVLATKGIVADYAAVREAETLLPPRAGFSGPWRALIAARVGSVRLIDNAAWHVG
jgi:pantoate--beta-alanine ligase